MKTFSLTYGLALITLFLLDCVWLGTTSETLYRANMVGIVRDTYLIAPAVIFYFIYAFGLSYLVLWPGLFGTYKIHLVSLMKKASVFGLVCYATYDLTGLAVLKHWSLKLSLIDMAWGTLASLLTSLVVSFALKLLGQRPKPSELK